jgi:hypothetical protein
MLVKIMFTACAIAAYAVGQVAAELLYAGVNSGMHISELSKLVLILE